MPPCPSTKSYRDSTYTHVAQTPYEVCGNGTDWNDDADMDQQRPPVWLKAKMPRRNSQTVARSTTSAAKTR
jgi:hypothetical protein